MWFPTRSKYGRQNTPMLLGSFLAGEASWNLQSQSLQCINHLYDLFIRSVYFSDVFFHRFPRRSDSEPPKLFLGELQPRGIWADVLCAGDLSTQPGCSEEEVPPDVGKITSADLHLCSDFFMSATCKGISWLSVIGILDHVVSMV